MSIKTSTKTTGPQINDRPIFTGIQTDFREFNKNIFIKPTLC